MFGKLISWFRKDKPVEVKKELRITFERMKSNTGKESGLFRAEIFENGVNWGNVAYGDKAEVMRRVNNFIMNSTPGYEIVTCPEWDA